MASFQEDDPGWQYLRQSPDVALAEQAKIQYDPKTTVWVPDAEEGFVIGELQTTDGGKATVKTATKEVTIKKDDLQEVNPPKFEKSEDMSNLTFLNEASVLHNLRARYYSMLIYTYSGLFCVVINPYKRLPIYTPSVCQMFMGRRRNEMPPHLFAVSDEAYRNMINDSENQSMLITGESGAGKTENTKKVISYFATVGATQKAGEKKGPSIEDQIVQTNPVLEAYGNAKTVRNNNSSRFGKFIRVHFNAVGKLAGADIAHYLLEKSRVIRQAPGERCYHIFYQIMSGRIKGLREQLLLEPDIKKYHFVSQAELTVPGMDDDEEMGLTDEAFDIMGFAQSEKDNLYKLCALVMHKGEMKFKQRPREEQAESDGTDEAEKFCQLAGIDCEQYLSALLKPRVKVGNEWVSKGQNLEQVSWGVGAMAKALYSRSFHWTIERCNRTLESSGSERKQFIGVLDIAGFEIFDLNSFEQLWINFVNEKLQQFFNHHMFVLEQEEYQREGIQWEFIDFGLDLQSCIELIEKPLGLISMLDEECIVPKASDTTYAQKLNDQHLGKHPNFQKPRPPKGKQAEAHFAVVHYAGTVRYNVTAWLEKNKDPLNDSVVSVLKSSANNQLLKDIWSDYVTQIEAAEAAKRGKEPGKKKGKSGSMMTVSQLYRESLNNLMSMLHTTHPHFIRCIIPNEQKKSGLIEAPLCLNQLTCNGVLEGIRICRKGFPNRMVYPDFKHRYAILAPDEAVSGEPKPASEKMIDRLTKEQKLMPEQYRVGLTKVFFKAGVLAHLEELRDEALGKILTKFQCACRHYLAALDYRRRLEQSDALFTIQSNIRAWCTLRTWPWFRLYGIVKPMLVGQKSNEEIEKLEARVIELETTVEAEKAYRFKAEKENEKLAIENENLAKDLEKETDGRKAAEKQAAELNQEVIKLEDANAALEKNKKALEGQVSQLNNTVSGLQSTVHSLEKEKEQAHREIAALHEEMVHQDKIIGKLTHDRKIQEEVNHQLSANLDTEVAKNERLENGKQQLEDRVSELERLLEHEKKTRMEVEKVKRKLDADCRQMQDELDQSKMNANDIGGNLKRKEAEMASLRSRMEQDDGMICKLQLNMKELLKRIEQLEDETENERRGRTRAEKLRLDLQEELDSVNQRVEEASGALSAQLHLNKQSKEEVSRLSQELEERNLSHETQISDLCNIQWSTLAHLRDLSVKAASLESEAGFVLHSMHTPTSSKSRINTATIISDLDTNY